MMPFRTLLATAIFVTSGSISSTSENPVEDIPIEVSSEDVTYDVQTGTTQFDTSVIVTRGDLSIKAESVTVHQSTETPEEIELIEVRDSVHVEHAGSDLWAENCVYKVVEALILCGGGVEISFAPGSSTLTGQNLTYDIDSGQISITGQPRALIRPDSE